MRSQRTHIDPDFCISIIKSCIKGIFVTNSFFFLFFVFCFVLFCYSIFATFAMKAYIVIFHLKKTEFENTHDVSNSSPDREEMVKNREV